MPKQREPKAAPKAKAKAKAKAKPKAPKASSVGRMRAATSVAPESLAPESLAPESLAPESLAPESAADSSAAPDSISADSLAAESIVPVATTPAPPIVPTELTLAPRDVLIVRGSAPDTPGESLRRSASLHDVVAERSAEDVWYLSSPLPLAEPPARLGDLLRTHATKSPRRVFLMERVSNANELRRITYAEALAAAEVIAGWLTERFASEEKLRNARVLALSGNSVDHALLMLGCFLAGIPFVPISPAYSLMSQDFAKLRTVIEKVRPSVIYVESIAPFSRALEVVRSLVPDATLVIGSYAPAAPADLDAIALSAIIEEYSATPAATETTIAREKAITPDHVAKILFTSGSTAFPKGVPNTHRMLCANQQMIAQLWPFLGESASDEQPPVIVDWLPWSHTFGGNHNFNMVLFHGGTLFVDEGKPTEALIGASLRNLHEVSPTLYFNVPAGYAALVPHLEKDDELRRAFFARLRVMFYAAAALPPDLWNRLTDLAARSAPDRDIFMTTAWGSTETSPLATSMHFREKSAGNIGLPAPGVTLKLVPNGKKLEVRVKGPNVMTAYLDEAELTSRAFDEEGFYRIGDAVKFADPDDPSAGLLFDGRVAEDFKLSSGTWVSVTTIRTGIVARAGGLLLDVVVCGQDREEVTLLAWPSMPACRALLLEANPAASSSSTSSTQAALTPADIASSPRIRDRVRNVIQAWNHDNPASSMRIARVLLLEEPPNIDAGEITDKGYTNQRTTLERRNADVERLYSAASDSASSGEHRIIEIHALDG